MERWKEVILASPVLFDLQSLRMEDNPLPSSPRNIPFSLGKPTEGVGKVRLHFCHSVVSSLSLLKGFEHRLIFPGTARIEPRKNLHTIPPTNWGHKKIPTQYFSSKHLPGLVSLKKFLFVEDHGL